MKKNALLAVACSFFMLVAGAQNVGINTDATLPNKNAILDIKSGSKGLLIPRMDSVARKRIPDTKGLLVYDITTDNFWYNTGKEWRCIPNDKDRDDRDKDAWLLKGNNNTKDGINFLGTTNNVPLNIRVNNQPSGRIDSAKGSTFWGYKAGFYDTALNNTACGFLAFKSNVSGNGNTVTGSGAMSNSTTGFNNVADGYQALHSNLYGSLNTAVGALTLYNNIDGVFNTAIGYSALHDDITGRGNTAIGYFALLHSDGYYNSANGAQALQNNTTGSGNTAVGPGALFSNTTGSQNVGVGPNGMQSNTEGNYNTVVGAQADVAQPNLTNATALGSYTIVDASNKVRIGNSAVTVIEGQVPFTTPSDGRYKFNIRENVKGLDFILQLRPVTYQFDVKRFDAQMNQANKPGAAPNYAIEAAYDQASQIRRTGFIAQEVEQAANVSGYDFSGIIKPKTDQDHYSLSYDAFVVPLVKAVQEQQQIIQTQTKQLAEQRQTNDAQNKRIDSLEKQLVELKQFLQSSQSLPSSK